MEQEIRTDTDLRGLWKGRMKRFKWAVLGLLASIMLYSLPGFRLPVMDDAADRYFSQAITKAGLAYGTCRVLNASVSFLKESDIELQPAGLGISLAVGQILDPIDDMTERLSEVVVTAITSLGVQKLVHEISLSLSARILALLVLLMSLFSLAGSARIAGLQELTLKLLLIMLILRIGFPVASMANEFLYENYFSAKIQEANQGLKLGFTEQKCDDIALGETEGVVGTFTRGAAFLKDKTAEFQASFREFVNNSGAIIENLLRLTYLYVGLFVIQVLLIPLGSFWLLLRALDVVFGWRKSEEQG